MSTKFLPQCDEGDYGGANGIRGHHLENGSILGLLVYPMSTLPSQPLSNSKIGGSEGSSLWCEPFPLACPFQPGVCTGINAEAGGPPASED